MKKFLKSFSLILAAFIIINEPVFATLPNEDIIDMFDQNGIYYYNPSGSNDYCGSISTKLVGDSIEEKMWNFYIDKGFNDAQVAGILGNGMAESGNQPTRASNSTFYGLFQWGYGRKAALVERLNNAGLGKYVNEEYWPAGAMNNIPADDLDKILYTELEFSVSEEKELDWQTEIKKQSTPEAAAEVFLTIFERAVNGNSPIKYYQPFLGQLYQGTEKRRNFAREFYDKYSGKGVSTAGNSFEEGANLSIIGDSITVASKAALLKKFPKLTEDNINAAVSRTWSQGIEVAKLVSPNLKQNVIFALGANSSRLTSADIDTAIQAIGTNNHIIFVTDWSTTNDYASNNNLFFEYAKNNSNIIVADWKKLVEGKAEEYFFDNYIHPNEKGAELFAQLLYDTANSNLDSNGCAINGEFIELVKAYAWPEWHSAPFTDRMPAYAAAVAQSQKEGRYVGGSVNGVPGIDCGGFVTVIVQNSGIEPNYNDTRGATETQEKWAKDHNWILLNGSPDQQIDTSILQAGDVAFTNGHTFIYVGDIPGFDSKIASASYSSHGDVHARAPMAGREDIVSSNGIYVRWYRNPKYSTGNYSSYQQNLQNTTYKKVTLE